MRAIFVFFITLLHCLVTERWTAIKPSKTIKKRYAKVKLHGGRLYVFCMFILYSSYIRPI